MKRINKPLLALSLVTIVFGSGIAAAGALDSLAKQAGGNLAAPLAEKFGVPAGGVTALFGSGLDLKGVVQTLLITKASGSSLDKVSGLLGSNKNDIPGVAKTLGVDPSAYGEDKVSKVIDEVGGPAGKGKAAAEGATDAATDKANQTGDKARGALDSVLAPK